MTVKLQSLFYPQAGGYIKYALIGLAPYSFHFDESLTYYENFRLLQYCIAFNDLHNFWLPVEQYKNLFQKEFLNLKIDIESDINSITPVEKNIIKHIDSKTRIEARERIDTWKDRNFPETVKENVQILDNYLTLCEENKVRPIMFLPPFTEGYKKYFSKQKLDEFYYLINKAQKKHPSAKFLDGWRLPSFPDTDFFDTDHLNIQGAAKFSTIFNNLIEQLDR